MTCVYIKPEGKKNMQQELLKLQMKIVQGS